MNTAIPVGPAIIIITSSIIITPSIIFTSAIIITPAIARYTHLYPVRECTFGLMSIRTLNPWIESQVNEPLYHDTTYTGPSPPINSRDSILTDDGHAHQPKSMRWYLFTIIKEWCCDVVRDGVALYDGYSREDDEEIGPHSQEGQQRSKSL